MDLTRLYNLTTPELREEAERLGVSDTYALSRAQLIHAIRSKVGGPPAEGLLGRVLGFAKWAFQSAGPGPREQAPAEAASPEPEAGETDDAPREPTMRFIRPSTAPPASDVPRSAPPPMPSIAPSSSPPPVPTVAPSAPVPAPGSAPGPAAGSGPAAGPGSAPVSAPAPLVPSPAAPSSPAPSQTTAPPPAPEAAQASAVSRPPAGVFSTSGAPFEEPFPTRTMARILAEQGHYKRALAIYATLMRAEPDDLELREEADAVQSRSRARRSHLH